MCNFIDAVFDDKRAASMLLFCWMCIVLSLFYEIGILHSKFMKLGPSDDTVFMNTPINTWYRYNLVAVFTFINTCVNDFMSDSISPWILNTITDHKNKYIPYPKWMCILISQFWSVYCNLMSIFNVFLSLTQIDFVLIRTAADLCMSMYTNMKFLQYKQHNFSKYKQTECHTTDIDLSLHTASPSGDIKLKKMTPLLDRESMIFSIDDTGSAFHGDVEEHDKT
jgi:hypothetical protein